MWFHHQGISMCVFPWCMVGQLCLLAGKLLPVNVFFFIRFHFLMEKATTTTTTTTKDKGNYSSRQAHSRVVKSVCGIRVQRGGIIDQKSGIYDHSLGIRDLKPQDRISSFFGNQRSGYTIFVGSGIKLCQASGINDQKFGYINKISDEKYTSLQACS